MAAPRAMQICVLDADPDLGRLLSARDLAVARGRSLARLRTLRAGIWRPEHERFDEDGLGLLVLDGIIRRRITLHGRSSCELVGAGDLLRPWHDEDRDASLAVAVEWNVRTTTLVAVLDADVLRRLASWPSIISELAGRTERRARSMAVRMAIARVPSVELRVELLFWHLADRWGRVGVGGVVLPLEPEQETIGHLVGASRSRVNASLRALKCGGKVCRHPDGWLLTGERPQQARTQSGVDGRGPAATPLELA